MTKTASPFRAVNDATDRQAKALVDQFMTGAQTPEDERRLRGQLAALVLGARVAEQVVFGRYRFEGQVGHDLVDEITFDIEKKISGIRDTDRSHSTLDLGMIHSGRSLLGWARQMMKVTVISKHRDLKSRARKCETFTGVIRDDPNASERASAASARLESVLSTDADSAVEDTHFDRALEPFDRMLEATSRRPRELMHVAAAGVFEYLGIHGQPVVSVDSRRELQSLLGENAALPTASLGAWIALVEGTMTAEQQNGVQDVALRFWDGLTLTEAQTLFQSGPRTNSLVMRGFVSGAVRPTQEAVQTVVDAATALLPESVEDRVPEAVDAVIASRCSRIRADGTLSPLAEAEGWTDQRVDRVLKAIASSLGPVGRVAAVERMIVRLIRSTTGLSI